MYYIGGLLKINPRGFWENDTEEGHGIDPNLAQGLIEFFTREYFNFMLDYDNSSVYIADVGCGTGYYTKKLTNRSELFCKGYDGNPNTPQIAGDNFKVFDFTQDAKSLGIYDWVLCLEVGEHIPEEYEQIFLDNLAYLADYGIVLSWSIPGFGGDGHVNPKSNQYIIHEMKERGFKYSKKDTKELRNSASEYPSIGWWFRETLMCFRREKDYRGTSIFEPTADEIMEGLQKDWEESH